MAINTCALWGTTTYVNSWLSINILIIVVSLMAIAAAYSFSSFFPSSSRSKIRGFVRFEMIQMFISVAIIAALLAFSATACSVSGNISNSLTHRSMDPFVYAEYYISSTFNTGLTLLIYAIIVFAANILTYNTGYSAPITAIVALVLTPLIFYAPSSIVIDEKGLFRAMKASVAFFFKKFDYFIIWIVVAILLFTVLDFVFIHAFGTVASRYVMLVVSSIFVLPFLMLMQGEMYLNRFGLLKV